jgi:scyllo-inositol 2-dehydrogenase (NADP+)
VRYLVVGLGNIGQRRRALLADRCIATVDPLVIDADFRHPSECPLDRYDAAILAVPNESKLTLLSYFLGCGKHVLVEKPLLFPDREGAERLAHLASQFGSVWYTSYNHRFEPLIERMHQRLSDGAIGDLYHGRFFYGNGTVRHVVGTWREQGLGVVEDLGSHLLDLSGYLLGCSGQRFVPWTLARHESSNFDHAVFASEDGRLVLEASFLSWKNTFSIDLFGERGSLHIEGLPKWGSARFVERQRVLPSGLPLEITEAAVPGEDLTWDRDLAFFEGQIARHETSFANDNWISCTLQSLVGAEPRRG